MNSELEEIALSNLTTILWDYRLKHLGIVGIDLTGRNLVQVDAFTDPSGGRDHQMNEVRHAGVTYHVAGNGDHVQAIAEAYAEDRGMPGSLERIAFDPGTPSVPRIITSCRWEHNRPIMKAGALVKSPLGEVYELMFRQFNGLSPGFGYCIMTYAAGEGIEGFDPVPHLVPLYGPARTVASFEDRLERSSLASLAMKFIPKSGAAAKTVTLAGGKSRS